MPLGRRPRAVLRDPALHRVPRRPARKPGRPGAQVPAARRGRHRAHLGPRSGRRHLRAPLNQRRGIRPDRGLIGSQLRPGSVRYPSMRKCGSCGYLLLGDGNSCGRCGALLPADADRPQQESGAGEPRPAQPATPSPPPLVGPRRVPGSPFGRLSIPRPVPALSAPGAAADAVRSPPPVAECRPQCRRASGPGHGGARS